MDEHKKIDIEKNLHHKEEGRVIDLSREKMNVLDYEWLADIIKKSCFLERIVLPPLLIDEAETILSILDEATIKNSTLVSINLQLSEKIKASSPFCDRIRSRLERNKRHIFAVHGGGNIGLGLMADIISNSPFKYEIVATSNNSFTCGLINSVNKLWIQHAAGGKVETALIKNIRMVSREKADIIKLYGDASMAAICVTPTVMPEIAKDIAEAIIARYELDGSGLKILVLMNIPNCDIFVREKIHAELIALTKDSSYAGKILRCIEFVPSVIDRIVTPIQKNEILTQLRLQLETASMRFNYQSYVKEEVGVILQSPTKLAKAVFDLNLSFSLFNAEKVFSMHVSNGFPEALRFPAMSVTKDLKQIETIKNKYINGPHAILAWSGALLGCATISESIKHPFLFSFIKEMMEKEIRPILSAEYPDISKEEFKLWSASFFERCFASTNDPVTRVGRDPLRKLDSGGRIRGTIELARKHQLKIATHGLEQGMAAGYLYAVKGIDPANPGCQKIMEIYGENNNSFMAVLCYNGPAPSGHFSGLHPYKDQALINNVLNKITDFNKWNGNEAIHKPLSTTANIMFGISNKTPVSWKKYLANLSDFEYVSETQAEKSRPNNRRLQEMILSSPDKKNVTKQTIKMKVEFWNTTLKNKKLGKNNLEIKRTNHFKKM